MLKEADDLEQQAASVKEPNIGFVPGIVPATVGVLPGLTRALPTAAAYGVAGAIGGVLLTKNPRLAVAAGGAMAGAGFTVGMAMDTARTEQGLAYRQYIKAGADPKTAAIAADLVALGNGGLQAIPAEKIFNLVPGISNLLAGKKTRDLVSALITSNTGRAALQRFALRAGESGLLMALVGGGQELVRELGALGAGADDQLHGGRIWDAATGGLQQGLGFGLGHAIAPFIGERREAQIGQARGEMYRAISNESKNSKLREQMPEAFKNYVNAVIAEHGNVEEAKAPAEKLTSLLQKEGVTQEQLEERMPDVAKQLKNAAPKDEIVIPMGDLATHLAPLKSFDEFSQDLRVGDDTLTPRESKKIGELADKFEKEQPAAKEGEEVEPGRKVYDDVYTQLTEAGQAPEVAQKDAALWAAFATARGERLGVDPFDYYKSRAVSVGTEFPDAPGTTLGQGPEYGGTHRPPGPHSGAPLHDLTGRGEVYPDDVYSDKAARYYGTGNKEMDQKTINILQKLRGKPDAEVTVYRAVPKNLKGTEINAGDWITVNREYAKEHGRRFEGGAKIIEKKVRADEVYTNGDSIHEAGYWPKGSHTEEPEIAEFGEELKKSLVKGADVPDDQLDQFLATEKNRKAGKMPTDDEINEAIAKAQAWNKPTTLKQEVREAPTTPEFKKWFEGSKIVDKDGNPLVVYHGTTASAGGKEPFTEFRTSPEFHEEGVENVSGMDPTAFLGAHFAKERSVAEKFARGIYRSKDYKEAKGYVFETYLSIKNPVRMTESEMRERIFQQDVNDPLVDQYLEEGGGEDPEAAYERYANDPEWRQEVNEDILLNNSLRMEDESMLSSFASELADGFKRSLGEGVDGIIYKNEIEGGTSYVAFKPEQVKSVNNRGTFDPNNPSILEQRGGAAGTDGYRGKISFDDARSYFNITLTGKANLSTFLHESGHAFFEFMRKDAESGHAQSQEDFGKLLEWMGVKAGEQPSTEQLEQFARGFEGYLMEGKAPAPELRGIFRTFASWLKQVYRGMKNLGVTLTDDVRGVMDRMLATDKEIEKAKEGLGLEPMKKPEGMSDAEYKAYTEKFGKAMEAGRNELEEMALKEFRNTIGEERAKTQADVDAATRQDPAHNAYEILRTGKRLDGGEAPEELAGKKLDREAVAEAGHKGIKWANITAEGGLDPDIAAPLLGYENGPALLEALEARRSRSKEIKEETERRMMDKYPNADIAKMSEQAVKALHLKDDVGNVLWLEAKALGKQVGADDPRTARAVVKEIARRRTSEMTALEMQPGRFARGEERAAGEWADAMKAKDFAEAHKAKLEQILNHEMFKAVSEAKDEIDSIRNYLDGFNELPNRRRLGKAGQSYLNAVDAIISDIELKRQTNKTLQRRASLESYLAEMENEDGALITIPAELRSEVGLKNYKQMTLEDLRTVHDAVANIETMARLKNKLFDGRERRNFLETAVRLSESVKANLGDSYAEKPGAPQNPGWLDKKKEMLRRSVAEMKKIEFLARAMDGGETAGWVHSVLFQPFATAEEKALNLTKKITETLLKPLREMSLKERAQFDKTVDFLGTPMKMRDVIAVALNMGNNGNKKKLLDGYAYRGWTEEKVIGRLGELLTDKHLDIIDHFWKTIGSLWPEIKALSERTTGVAPPKVEAAKLSIRGRELEGGYYPIVYDRDRSYKAEQFAQKKGDLFENNFLKPGVSKGFTESRTQFAAPILLSLNVIPSHMNEVIHYLTHLEPIRAVDRLMAHSAVRKSVTEAMGKETYNLFRPWLQAIAHDGVVSNNTTTIDNVLRHLRVGASVTRLGFRLSNSIMQGFNILSSVKELGGFVGGSKYLALGMKAWMSDFEQFTDPFKYVHENSPEIRGKTEKYEHNLIGNFDHFTSAFSEFGHYKERLGHFAMSFMTLAWKSVEAMTWYAAREKAFDRPRAPERVC
jgi:hypothetical protein